MANDGGDFARSMSIATSGLRAQAGRMRVISENIANADSTASTAGGDPYRRKVPTFSSALDRTLDAKVVTLGKVGPTVGVSRQARARQSGGGRRRQRQISQRQSADRNDRHARRAAILRGEPQHHQRHAPDDSTHARHPQGLNRKP
jgi:flagellar basal body rod protein FlgB